MALYGDFWPVDPNFVFLGENDFNSDFPEFALPNLILNDISFLIVSFPFLSAHNMAVAGERPGPLHRQGKIRGENRKSRTKDDFAEIRASCSNIFKKI